MTCHTCEGPKAKERIGTTFPLAALPDKLLAVMWREVQESETSPPPAASGGAALSRVYAMLPASSVPPWVSKLFSLNQGYNINTPM